MAKINLLPWRETERKRRLRDFGILVAGGLALALLISLFVHFQIENQISYQAQRNDLLQNEIAQVDKKIKEIQDLEKIKANLIARMNVIQRLQQSRPEVVHLFDEFVNTMPDGVYLTEIVQTGPELKVAGRAQSNARVSAYMRNIDSSQWIGKSDLKKIEQMDQKRGDKQDRVGGMSQFNLSAQQLTKALEEEQAGAAEAKRQKGAPPKANIVAPPTGAR